MKKKTKVLVVCLIIIALVLIIPTCIYLFKSKQEYSKFSPHDTGSINENIIALRDDFVNMYFLKKNDVFLAIDAGSNLKNVKKELVDLGIDPNKVSTILLTHTDSDHIASIALFPNASVYISELEEEMINGKVHRTFIFNNKLSIKHKLLKDGEKISVNGWNIKTIIVPGHTVGSVCYLVDDKYLFTGDNLALMNGKIEPFNNFFNMNTKQQITSLKKITSLDNIELILTAHYGITDKTKEYFTNWNTK